jgi:hypothetical protein
MRLASDNIKRISLCYLNESFADHRVLADGAVEAIVMPGQRLEGHKLGAAEATFS